MCYKKPVLGIASSIVTVILTFLTGNGWRELLISGGKDTTLLGFQRYPAALIILGILLVAAFVVLAVSIIWIARRNEKGKKNIRT